MIYWDIQAGEGFSGLYIDEKLLKQSTQCGMNANSLREFFLNVSSEPIVFSIISKNGKRLLPRNKAPMIFSDILIWSWVRFFSSRARNLMIEFGSSASDFLLCKLDSLHDQCYFMYLPTAMHDVVDVEKSVFGHVIPIQNYPPLLMHMTFLALKDVSHDGDFHHSFLAKMPGYSQLLAEMFVSDELKNKWESAGFIGANFRNLGMSNKYK